MNTGHTHNEGDLYADDIHDAEFQDAEIIDEEIHEHATTAPQQETAAVQEEPQVVEPQAQENIDIQFNDNPAEFAQRQAQAERQKRTNTCVCSLNLKTTNDVLPKKNRTYSNLPDKMS